MRLREVKRFATKSKSVDAQAESFQSCPTLCIPMYSSLPGSSVHGISQARVLEWVAISSSRELSRPRVRTHISVSCIDRRVFFFYHSLEFKSILGSFRIRASADYRAIALELVRGDVDLVIGNILKLSQKDVLKFLCFLKGEKHLKKA